MGGRINDWDKTSIRNDIEQRIQRVRHTNPFPITGSSVHSVYMRLIPHDAIDKILFLMTDETVTPWGRCWFTSNYRAVMTVEVDDVKARRIIFQFNDRRISCETDIPVRRDHPQYNDIVQWWRDAEVIDKEIVELEKYVYAVTEQLNTVGQMYRVWPEIVDSLSSHHHILKGAKKRSPLTRDFIADWMTEPEDIKNFESLRKRATLAYTRGMMMDDKQFRNEPNIWIYP